MVWCFSNQRLDFFQHERLFFWGGVEVCNPTEGNDVGKSKVKRKSYRGQREREAAGERKHVSGSEEKPLRSFAHFI